MMLTALLFLSQLAATPLPPPAQALLDQARTPNPARHQFAIDQDASIEPTGDGRSFYLLWLPKNAVGKVPLIVTLHGHGSWAFDEMILWHPEASKAGYGILALQWWFGGDESNDSYY